MTPRLLDFLCCPDCRHPALHLTVHRGQPHGTETVVLDGELRCGGCGSRFPVIDGIPRMLPAALRPYLVAFHPGFFDRYRHLVPDSTAAPLSSEVARTLEGYSWQHLKLRDSERELDRWRANFVGSLPVDAQFFRGKIGADIGCGSGRHLYWARRFGAEMVGLDLSEGVTVARAVTDADPRCHIVQGDIYHVPLRDGVFDFVYSLGVIHHLPRPEDGFRRLLPTLRPGGRIFVWVYGLSEMRRWYRLSHLTWLRGVARLPRPAQYAASVALAAALELALWMPCRLLSRLPGGGAIVARIPLADACRRAFRAKIRSVFDRLQPPVTHYLSRPELEQWLSGLTETSVSDRDGRGWIAVGRTPTSGRGAMSGVAAGHPEGDAIPVGPAQG